MSVYDPADESAYQGYHHSVKDLEFHVHDLTQGTEHHERPEAIALRGNLRHLREEIEMKRDPRTIENRIKMIQRDLERAKHQTETPFIHYGHIDELQDRFKDMREGVRRFSGY